MIRYVASFPASLNEAHVDYIRDQIAAAAGAREARDIVLTNGGTIIDMRPVIRVPALVRRARARAR